MPQKALGEILPNLIFFPKSLILIPPPQGGDATLYTPDVDAWEYETKLYAFILLPTHYNLQIITFVFI